MPCSPCAQRRAMLREAQAQAQAGQLKEAARTVANVGRHIINGRLVLPQPKQEPAPRG